MSLPTNGSDITLKASAEKGSSSEALRITFGASPFSDVSVAPGSMPSTGGTSSGLGR